MKTKDFEVIVKKHSMCPFDHNYNALALAGEAGEVCNAVKKIAMAELHPEWVGPDENQLKYAVDFYEQSFDELGDVLFYLTRLVMDQGTTLEYLMDKQAQKLKDQSAKYQRTFLK